MVEVKTFKDTFTEDKAWALQFVDSHLEKGKFAKLEKVFGGYRVTYETDGR